MERSGMAWKGFWNARGALLSGRWRNGATASSSGVLTAFLRLTWAETVSHVGPRDLLYVGCTLD